MKTWRFFTFLVFLAVFFVLTGCTSLGVLPSAAKAELQSGGYPIAVIRIGNTFPNSVGGVDVNITWQNISDKDIKYITFFVEFYNAVGDKVPNDINRLLQGASLKATGPYRANQSQSTLLTWKNVWYNKSIDKTVITKIEVIFMDNSSVSFVSSELDKVCIW